MGFQPYGSFPGRDIFTNKYKDLYVDTFYLSREMLLMDQAVIRSHNFESGVAGFILRQDGTVEINGLTVAEDIQSSNFVTGVSGYFLDYSTGSAEFNDVAIRGTLSTGKAGDGTGYVVVGESGALNYIKFYSDDADEYAPAQFWDVIGGSGTGRYKSISLYSGRMKVGGGLGSLYLQSEAITPGAYPYASLTASGTSGGYADVHLWGGASNSWHLETNDGTGTTTRIQGEDGSDTITYTADNHTWEDKSSGTYLTIIPTAITASKNLILPTGSAAAPSLSFSGDPDTGPFRLGADVLGWSAGGTERFRMSTAGFYHNASGGAYLKAGASAVGTPAFTFVGDGDTGIHWGSANDGRLVAGGVSIAQFTTGKFGPGSDNAITLGDASFRWSHLYATLIYSIGSYSNTTGSAANVYINSLGRLYRSTSGSKYKQNVKPVELADIVLRPVRYQHTGDRQVHYGFVAEELAEQDKRLAVIENGEVESYDDRALAAVLAAKINRLEERLTNLEKRGILPPEV